MQELACSVRFPDRETSRSSCEMLNSLPLFPLVFFTTFAKYMIVISSAAVRESRIRKKKWEGLITPPERFVYLSGECEDGND